MIWDHIISHIDGSCISSFHCFYFILYEISFSYTEEGLSQFRTDLRIQVPPVIQTSRAGAVFFTEKRFCFSVFGLSFRIYLRSFKKVFFWDQGTEVSSFRWFSCLNKHYYILYYFVILLELCCRYKISISTRLLLNIHWSTVNCLFTKCYLSEMYHSMLEFIGYHRNTSSKNSLSLAELIQKHMFSSVIIFMTYSVSLRFWQSGMVF